MIFIIIFLPILGSILSGLLSRNIGSRSYTINWMIPYPNLSGIIATLTIVISAILSYYTYFDVIVSHLIIRW